MITIRQAQVPITETNSSSKTVKLLSEECNGGHYMDISTGCHICGKGTYSPGGATVLESQCKMCPTSYTTTGLAVKVEDCVFLPGMKLSAKHKIWSRRELTRIESMLPSLKPLFLDQGKGLNIDSNCFVK